MTFTRTHVRMGEDEFTQGSIQSIAVDSGSG